MNRSHPTLHSIAAECGVSHVTVWRALRSHPNVHPETAQRIRRYAGDLGYSAENDGRVNTGLPRKRGARRISGDTTILVPYNKAAMEALGADNLFWEYVEGITEAATISRSRVVMAGFENAETELARLRDHLDKGAHGVLDFGLQTETLDYLAEREVPMVTLSTGRIPGPHIKICVSSDHLHGFHDTWRYLHEQGHSEIGFIGFTGSTSSAARLRECLAAGHLIDDSINLACSVYFDPAESNALIWRNLQRSLGIWSKKKWPTAFFCTNDNAAHRVISVLQEHGVSVPEDVSLVGFDNAAAARVSIPGITTIGNPRKEIGTAMLHLLENRIANRPGSHTASQVIPMQLIKRGSVSRRK